MDPVVEPVVTPPAGDPPAPAPAPAPVPAPAPAAEPWYQGRIDKLTGKNKELGEALSAKDQEIANLRARLQPAGTPPAPAPAHSPVPQVPLSPTDPAVRAAAAQLNEQQAFTDRCNAAAAEGRKAFTDFDSKVQALAQVVDQTDQREVAAYHQLVATALDTGVAEQLLYDLGSDPNLGRKMLGYSPAKLGMELEKMAQQKRSAPVVAAEDEPAIPASDPGVSRAPRPVTPAAARGPTSHSYDPSDPTKADKMSTEEWMKKRNEQAPIRRMKAGRG